MKYENREVKLCDSCMEQHEVYTVKLEEKGTFKGELVDFSAIYEYCSILDEYSENEALMRMNNLSQKDAYRIKVGLLTSYEIKEIRDQYQISQKDFSEVLCWGGATITRYENHQVQDRAHDDILRKIKSDPKWFLEMLERAKGRIALKAYTAYYSNTLNLLEKISNPYDIKFGATSYSIENLNQSQLVGESGFEFGFDTNHKYSYRYNVSSIPVEIVMADAV